MSGDIIDAIDGALGDWSVSADAVRWVPPDRRVVHDDGDAQQAAVQVGRPAFGRICLEVGGPPPRHPPEVRR